MKVIINTGNKMHPFEFVKHYNKICYIMYMTIVKYQHINSIIQLLEHFSSL